MKTKKKLALIIGIIILLSIALIVSFFLFKTSTSVSSGASLQGTIQGITTLGTSHNCPSEAPIYCGEDNSGQGICGVSEEHCTNWRDNQETSCKPDDPNWCCFDEGYILDYSAEFCCNPNTPHWDIDDRCWDYPVLNYNYPPFPPQPYWVSDNWYTRQSSVCTTYGPTQINQYSENILWKCDGTEYFECVENPQWIHFWQSKGQVIGKCGYQQGYCEDSFDCSQFQELIFSCSGDNIVSELIETVCRNHQCVNETAPPTIEESCQFGCTQESDGTPFCNEQPVECTTDDDCQEGEECTDGMCIEPQPKPFPTDLVIGISAIIILVIFISFFVYWMRRKK